MQNFKEDIIEYWDFCVKNYPNAPILKDYYHKSAITFSQADELSGKVYHYLLNNAFGPEDFIIINLKRSCDPIIAMLGVLKAGAAYVLTEENFPPERVDYIRKDCNSRLILDDALFSEIMKMTSKKGFRKVSANTAAFAIYTSGSTGNPKGVLHERGKYPLMATSMQNENVPSPSPSDYFALVTPLCFAAASNCIVEMLYQRTCLYVVPTDIVKNPKLLNRLFLEEEFTLSFMTPSTLRSNKLGLSENLRLIYTAGEPADNLYLGNPKILCVYGQSEAVFILTTFFVDKAYERCPVGKAALPLRFELINEEMCYENPYTRGYINLPEQTEKTFKDGLCHSGDRAVIDEYGNFTLIGRIDDLIKINGNRIEPSEIEISFKKITGITTCLVKASEANSKNCLFLYYESSRDINSSMVRKKMMNMLPDYMIPARFIRMDVLPLNINGKLSRKLLPEPLEYIRKTDKVLPTNPFETKLLESMKKVLGLSDISIDDDFYEIGGDSLSTIALIDEAGIYSLTASDIFKYRTIRNIAAQYLSSIGGALRPDNLLRLNTTSLNTPQPLTEEQCYMLKYQMYNPHSTMFVLPLLVELIPTIDLARLINAVNTLANIHNVLKSTIITNSNGESLLTYDANISPNLKIKNISDEEWASVKDNLFLPYESMENSPLYHFRLFKTPNHLFFYFDIHHIICDGTSLRILYRDLGQLYENIGFASDYYFFYLADRKNKRKTYAYREAKHNLLKQYDVPCTNHLPFDNDTTDNMNSVFAVPLKTKFYGSASPNVICITAALLALAECTGNSDVCVSWIFHGRDEAYTANTVGLFIRYLPVLLHVSKDLSFKDYIEDVTNQVYNGIVNSIYPFITTSAPVVTGDYFCVLFQDTILDIPEELSAIIKNRLVPFEKFKGSQSLLDIEIVCSGDVYTAQCDYNCCVYNENTIKNYIDVFSRICKELVDSE